MRKLILFNMITLDGFFEGSGQDISWHQVDEEFNDFAIEQIETVDTIIFGRITYEGMASFWPTPLAMETDPAIAQKMNTVSKIVVSHTLEKADWNNTRLIKENVFEEIARLKQQSGKDLIIFGSGNLASTFLQQGLIDEIRVIVNPVVLGAGTPLFRDIQPLNLTLLKTRTFRNGNVLLYYQPAHPAEDPNV